MRRALAAVFGSGGMVTMVAGSVSGYSAAGIRPGARGSVLSRRVARRRVGRSLGHGLWLGRGRMRGGERFVYRVAGGQVRVVAVARGSFSAKTLAGAAGIRAGAKKLGEAGMSAGGLGAGW